MSPLASNSLRKWYHTSMCLLMDERKGTFANFFARLLSPKALMFIALETPIPRLYVGPLLLRLLLLHTLLSSKQGDVILRSI